MVDQGSPESGDRLTEAKSWLRKGFAFERKGKYEEAIECYDKALSIIPNSADALDAKGWALTNLEKYDDALSYFDQALELKPKKARIWNNKGVALQDTGKTQEALSCYEKAIEIRPKFMFPWYNKGNILSDLGKFDEAIFCFDKAIELSPKYADAWNAKGNILLDLERSEDALICFDNALSINPKHVDAWIGKGYANFNLTKYGDSIECHDKAIELEPENDWAWHGKGITSSALERYEESIKCYEKSIEINPNNYGSWNGKGFSLDNLGKYDAAIKCYKKAIEIDPKDPDLWNNEGYSFHSMKMYKDAIECYDKAIDLSPKEALLWNNKGESLLELSKCQEALDCYDKATELDPNDPVAWEGKGKALKALGRDNEAEEAFNKAKELEEKTFENGLKPDDLPEIIRRIKSVLDRKGQVILYGPPGTGKTFWAIKAARELSAISLYNLPFDKLSADNKLRILGDKNTPGVVRMCSFHPAYGYEDFLEGYRPEIQGDSQISFVLKDGIFRRLCRDVLSAPDTNFYLIIDEINRGDIPRIFGELMTVLEKNKRDKSIVLPLSRELLKVPENLYIIGTMNTADRSIALLDTALRRRFGFIELMPNIDLLKDTNLGGINLGQWLKSLNKRICDNLGKDARNRQIGHSYLLEQGRPVSDFPKLAEVVYEEIVPLLEEYCYEDYSKLVNILGDALVDIDRQMIRSELFDESNYEMLIEALQDMVLKDLASEGMK